ncbi:erythroid differentiation-related factor 1-like [Limulus polyphemus]|uniref:Erythroid differentiation-related factor 1-like n=1 Tax=Limulus polyphemus TaxID=6850 RepID=A0ABM1SVV0_LIMPO|nr:erythroid differentiation-related factor 1-like [Limulus polyphemus]XP_022247754.1 erythroid differentiation-related factor 1-like [Limulus polyphemus]XP_022247755.1 erythroid differentiation-related factor 1-like [Limulus polyphemus]XP_022247756.1 erythroid differentiation-related factor 1-like [Limulus polyphemus]
MNCGQEVSNEADIAVKLCVSDEKRTENNEKRSSVSCMYHDDGMKHLVDLVDQSNQEEHKDGEQLKSTYPVSTDVKSLAVVKYTSVEAPYGFLRLSSNTNLNQPPANWLRASTKLHGNQWTFPKTTHSTIFSSFQMANNFTDCVSEVDVISDAENIKKLLKIPYSKSPISMMVHRVGKTILLDDFDIHSHLLRASQKQWEWLRKFYYEHILQSLQEKEKAMMRKNKSRCNLQNKNMFSKFLYYSVTDHTPGQPKNTTIDSSNDQKSEEENHEDHHRPLQPFSQYALSLPDPVVETQEEVLKESHEFLRNVLWNFEDIRMLIGTDMPIFGGGTHPAVSLRLRDTKKPINVLTGLDYWLDNLMCNVPEVVMCYHLDGIVQKYELLKTEEIPQLENSQFSPKVVKDIAQNILSFLKSNATKSGHTYWLFKGKNDDVVKLYDLTTLCDDLMDDPSQNPFKLPVAMLLYKVARNMKESADDRHKEGTICKLLKNCLTLLDGEKQPQVVTSVHYLLSDVYISSDLDPSTIVEQYSSEGSENSHVQEEDSDEDRPTSPSVEVKTLCYPHHYRQFEFQNNKNVPHIVKNWDERCHLSLTHVIEGLNCVYKAFQNSASTRNEMDDVTPRDKGMPGISEEKITMANPYSPIPLHYSPLKGTLELVTQEKNKNKSSDLDGSQHSQSDVDNLRSTKNNEITPLSSNSLLDWKACNKVMLYQKAAQVYCALAEASNRAQKFGQALKEVKLGILCCERAQQLVESYGKDCPQEPLAYHLGLAGDIHLMLPQGSALEAHQEDFLNLGTLDKLVLNFLEKDKIGQLGEYAWAYGWSLDKESNLNLSVQCYQISLNMWSGGRRAGYERLTKRLGNICNELGVFHMNQAIQQWEETGDTSENVTELFNKSFKFLQQGITAFESVSDIQNIALLNSNTGRLMRLNAHVQAPYDSGGGRKEVSQQEQYYHKMAIKYYKKSLDVLRSRDQYQQVWDTVCWELSTAYFSFACLLQDYAPLSLQAQEKVEEEVVSLMMMCLKLCETSNTPPAQQPLYQYRVASINHRLASLYHNSYRNHSTEDLRRKQLRLFADSYYSKSLDGFQDLENFTEFLRVTLERVGLWEHHLQNLTGFSSRLKTLHQILDYMLSAQPVIKELCNEQKTCKLLKSMEKGPDGGGDGNETVTQEEEVLETQKLLTLLDQRLRLVMQSMVKLYSSKGSKFRDSLKKWSRLQTVFTQQAKSMSLQDYLLFVMDKLQDTKEW